MTRTYKKSAMTPQPKGICPVAIRITVASANGWTAWTAVD